MTREQTLEVLWQAWKQSPKGAKSSIAWTRYVLETMRQGKIEGKFDLSPCA